MNRQWILAAALSIHLANVFNPTLAAEFRAGEPLGTVNEAGEAVSISANVRVLGSFRFTESCTFDPARNLILAMSIGVHDHEKIPTARFIRANGLAQHATASRSTIRSAAQSATRSSTPLTRMWCAPSTSAQGSRDPPTKCPKPVF